MIGDGEMPLAKKWTCDRCRQVRAGKQSTVSLFRGGPYDDPEARGRGWIVCGSCAEEVERFMTPQTQEAQTNGDH
jgi:hypothetical protein